MSGDAKAVGVASAEPASRLVSRPVLEVDGIGVTYGHGASAVHAIDTISFAVDRGEFVCIVGPSGCGKTTLLRTLSGLLRPTRGSVLLGGEKVTRPVPDLAVVFQDYSRSLFPWQRVWQNVAFPLRAQGLSRPEIHERCARALSAVGLMGFETKYPWQLSGGMQQRVAIARAIAYEPQVMVLDEPFASVDAQVRADLEDLVRQVRSETGVTMVLVTHDIDEAVYLSDRVIVLNQRPSSVLDVVPIDLPARRDQMTTREFPAFVAARHRIFQHIRASRRSAGAELEIADQDE